MDYGMGAICSPDLAFRRIMLNSHTPRALFARNLLVTDLSQPASRVDAEALVTEDSFRTSSHTHSKDNLQGYQFTVPTGREYWLHWDAPQRIDPNRFFLHNMEKMLDDNYVYLTSRQTQVCIVINN